MMYKVEEISHGSSWRTFVEHPYLQWGVSELRDTVTGPRKFMVEGTGGKVQRFDSQDAAQARCDKLNKVRP